MLMNPCSFEFHHTYSVQLKMHHYIMFSLKYAHFTKNVNNMITFKFLHANIHEGAWLIIFWGEGVNYTNSPAQCLISVHSCHPL